MKHETSKTLLAYWNELRGDRPAPRRFEIEPQRIAALLPDIFILERTDFETYRFRIAGTRICEQFGVEFRGSNFLDGWCEDDRLSLERGLLSIASEGGALHLTIAASGIQNLHHIAEFEIVLLPLLHTQPVADRFIGACCATEGPDWLGDERLAHRMLLSRSIIGGGDTTMVAQQAACQVPFLPQIRSGRLVKSERRQFRVYDGGLAGTPRRRD